MLLVPSSKNQTAAWASGSWLGKKTYASGSLRRCTGVHNRVDTGQSSQFDKSWELCMLVAWRKLTAHASQARSAPTTNDGALAGRPAGRSIGPYPYSSIAGVVGTRAARQKHSVRPRPRSGGSGSGTGAWWLVQQRRRARPGPAPPARCHVRRPRCSARRDDRSHATPVDGGREEGPTRMHVSRSDSVWHSTDPHHTHPAPAALAPAGRTPPGAPLGTRRLAGRPAACALAWWLMSTPAGMMAPPAGEQVRSSRAPARLTSVASLRAQPSERPRLGMVPRTCLCQPSSRRKGVTRKGDEMQNFNYCISHFTLRSVHWNSLC
jgi:hypothetical protein